jgi:fatty acid desaturase
MIVATSSTQNLTSTVLTDSRDLPFLKLIASILLIFVPLAFYFLTQKNFSIWVALFYWFLNFIVFLGPFTLMLHNICHRQTFQKGFGWIKGIVFWVLGPLFGQTPETYFAHHIGMHHVENNLKKDLSSTLHFQRDSLWHFSKYLGRFLMIGTTELGIYLFKHRRKKLARRILTGELAYYGVAISTLLLNWQGSLVVFWIPLIVIRIAMMTGNWAQHAFIDSDHPDNTYRNSITCIDSVYNKRCFNDGYHIGHHLKMNRHWSEMPEDFQANIETYRREGAIIFRKLDYFMIWIYLMRGRLDRLADYFVDLEHVKRSKSEIIALLKSRIALKTVNARQMITQSLVGLISVAILNQSSAHGLDHKNLDEGRPLRIEDAYAIAHGEIALEGGLGYDIKNQGSNRALFPLQIVYGAFPNTQFELGTVFLTNPRAVSGPTKSGDLELSGLYNFNQETSSIPAFGIKTTAILPTGQNSSGVDVEIKGLIVKSVALFNLFLNVSHTFVTETGSQRGDDLHKILLGTSYPIGANDTLVADIYTDMSDEKGRMHSFGTELGLRHQLTPQIILDSGAGTEFSGPSDRSSFLLRIGASLGI